MVPQADSHESTDHDSTDGVVTRREVIAAPTVEALAGVFDVEPPRDHLPELWHWTHLLDRHPQRDLGPDGHALTGLPAPPGPGRKRMFAGGRVVHLGLLRIGEEAERRTRVLGSTTKRGRSGTLEFVTVEHEISQGGSVVIREEQDIVYRPDGSSTPTPPTPAVVETADDDAAHDAPQAAVPAAGLDLRVDEALLFRFSALTYNAHRIHYDLAWAAKEGYDGLVVHGPLQAMMMGEHHRRHGGGLVGRTFAFRLVAPMIGPQTLTVVPDDEGPGALAVRDAHGAVTARSRVENL